MRDQALSDRRWPGIAFSGGLTLAAGITLIIGLVGFLLLTGDPVREDGNLCIGGGHAAHGTAMLAVGVAALLSAIASLVQALRGRRSWPFGVLGAGLVVVMVLLLVYIPNSDELNVGQC